MSKHLPDAVIVDRDGTLASVEHVRPQHRDDNDACPLHSTGFPASRLYPEDDKAWRRCRCKDWDAFNASIVFDAVVPGVAAILQVAKRAGLTIIMTSGRDGSKRREMEMWLRKNDLPIDFLLMRRAGDQRRDSTVKREIYERAIAPRFNVVLVIDDRPQVCETWRDLGLPLVQVTDPGILPPIARRG